MKKKVVKNRFEEYEDDDESSELEELEELEDFEDFSFNRSMSGLSRPVKFKNKYSKGGAEGNPGNFKSEMLSGKKKKKRLNKDDNFF